MLIDDVHTLASLLDQWTQPELFAAENITLAEEEMVYPDGSTLYRREVTITRPSVEVVAILLSR